MKKKILMITTALTLALLTGCGNGQQADNAATDATTTSEQSDLAESSSTPTDATVPGTAETPTEGAAPESHTHNYTEEITTAASCEADGLKTFTCECGDSYTEAIPATGHSYKSYVYNEDATYTADGTELNLTVLPLMSATPIW